MSLELNRIHAIAQDLLGSLACKIEDSFTVVPIPCGGNNKVFKLKTSAPHQPDLLVKKYFSHPGDPRDRLGSEFGFLSFLWKHGIRSIPQPLAKDNSHGIGLYEFLEGSQFISDSPTLDQVNQAMRFLLEINTNSMRQKAEKSLPDASEACFSIHDHLQLVEKRLQLLTKVPKVSAVDKSAVLFIREKLLPVWEKIKAKLCQRADQMGMDLEKRLSISQQCLSPSDFGFHNVIVEQGEMLRFIDFEYAGWDDPAKMICDFFCQPKVPVPLDYLEDLMGSFSKLYPDFTLLHQRIHLLFPVFRLKWCAILLNEFLKVGNKRRGFSSGCNPENRKKKEQLNKAERYFSRMILDSGL